MRSAHSGAVVMLNLHEGRCDALVIRPYGTEILHVPLVKFSNEKADSISVQLEKLARSRGSDERAFIRPRLDDDDKLGKTLAILWTEVVEPVLQSLGFMVCGTSNNNFTAFLIASQSQASTTESDLPHVTWCTTGPLSFLPLHAAGNYGTQSMVFDYVVSSYTPTLSALLSPALPSTAFSGILTVGQKSTPGLRPLHGSGAKSHTGEVQGANSYAARRRQSNTCSRISCNGGIQLGPSRLPCHTKHGEAHWECILSLWWHARLGHNHPTATETRRSGVSVSMRDGYR